MRQTGAGEQVLRSAGSDNSAVDRVEEVLSAWRPGPKGRSGARDEFRVCIGLGAKRWVFHKQTLGGVVGLRDGDEAKHSGPGRGGEERSLGRTCRCAPRGMQTWREPRTRADARGELHTDTVNTLYTGEIQ